MSKYNVIVDYLLETISANEIKSKQKLPTIRELARKFRCSKATVVRAYDELQQRHVVYTVPQDGYYLVHDSKPKIIQLSGTVNFVSAAPDESILPYQEIQHCLDQAIDKYRHHLFSYSQVQGLPSLLDAMVKYLQDFQVFTQPDHVWITAGAQQVLHILSAMPFPKGKTHILVEQPVYHGILQLIKTIGVPVSGVTRTFDGLDLEELEKHFATGNVKFFYTIPRFQNPLGTSLQGRERKQLLRLAEKYDVYIVEDDYLGDLEQRHNSYPLYYEDVSSRVIYIKSFSKTLLPGLRIAAVVVPPALAKSFKDYKRWTDFGTSILSQGALELYIQSGMITIHRKKIRAVYAQKMKLLQEMVEVVDAPYMRWHIPDTGVFVCGEFLGYTDIDRLIGNLHKRNILIQPIRENYLPSGNCANILKLSVSTVSQPDLTAGFSAVLEEIRRLT